MSERLQCDLCGCTILPGEKACRGCGTLQSIKKRRSASTFSFSQLVEKAFVPTILLLGVLAALAIMYFVFPAPVLLQPGRRLFIIIGILSFATAAVMILDAGRPGPDGERINQGDTLKLFFSCIILWFAVVPMYMRARSAVRGPGKSWEYKAVLSVVGIVLGLSLLSLGLIAGRHYERSKNQKAAQEILRKRIEDLTKPAHLSVTPAP